MCSGKYTPFRWKVMRGKYYKIDLPSLQSIHLGNNALKGEGGERRMTTREPPYNYSNIMTMRSENE